MKRTLIRLALAGGLGALPLLAQEKKDVPMKGEMPMKGEGKASGMMMGT